LGKKVLIADVCSRVADSGFDGNLERLPASGAWLSLLAYTLQIYFDFSGYSDMAIGLARMFGFRFPENFNHPYAAVSVTDFWRRWHMSLSQWFRDYLYIPLGGNRGGTWQTYRNLAVVFLVTGLWHGAAWTFVCWGAYHGVMLMVERATGLARVSEDRWVGVRRVLTLVVVMGSWAIFRVPDGERGLEFFRALMGEGNRWVFPGAMVRLMDVQTMAALGVGAMALVVPRGWMTMGKLLEREDGVAARARGVVLLVLFPVVLVQVLASGYSPFLYFQF
jgi:alginate O-acetyltransferase complex protein AlgI